MPGTNTPPKAARKQSERARPHEVHQDRRAGHDQRGRASHGAQERERNCQPKGHRQARQRKGVIHPTTLRLKTVIATRNLEAAQRLGLKPNCFLYCTARKCNFRVRNEPELTEQSQKNKSDQRCKMELPGTRPRGPPGKPASAAPLALAITKQARFCASAVAASTANRGHCQRPGGYATSRSAAFTSERG
jgi:hypothetical protein